jgi:hypothetical protein
LPDGPSCRKLGTPLAAGLFKPPAPSRSRVIALLEKTQ